MDHFNSKFKTLVFGASTKKYRYSYRAVHLLALNGFEAVPVGLSEGEIDGIQILTGHPDIKNIHTISMYVNKERQIEHYGYFLELKPKRIIFNPGTENPELTKLATEKGIKCENSCTLVLLSIGQYADEKENVTIP